MIPLTPGQVKELRIPSWFQLVPISEYQGDLTSEVLCKDKWQGQVTEECRESAFGEPRSEVILAYLAENIANGHLPPEALDDVWRRVEGKPSREAELLRNLVEWYDAAYQARHVAARYELPPEEMAERVSVANMAVARFGEELSVARKWVEEHKP